MNFIEVLLLFFLASAVVNGESRGFSPWRYKEGQRWIFFPDGDGNMHLVDLHKEEIGYKYDAEKTVRFFLYTRDFRREEIFYGNDEALDASHFKLGKPVRIVSHGWNSKGVGTINVIMSEAFLSSEDQNVIILDWSKGSNVLYSTACKNVIPTGKFLAKFIDWLVSRGTPISKFHLLGHSLGGHLVGVAGRSVTTGIVPYISSLDPANPNWGSKSERIRPSDADYVEVIHTDGGDLGLKEPVGHADFYPNRGSSQPGCSLSVSCSHSRAYEFMADSIDHDGFMSQECTDYTEMYKKRCANLSQMHMGGSRPKNARGIFYLETNKKKPFYKH